MQDMLSVSITPDWQALIDNIQRKGTPDRVHFMELFLDQEVQDEIYRMFGLADGLDENDPYYGVKRHLAVQEFLGYDYVRCGADRVDMPYGRTAAEDTAEFKRKEGRQFVDEHSGPIMSWDDFERYPWPDVDSITLKALEWYQDNLPDGMCVIGGGGFAHFLEWLTFLMGYETLCYALYEQRDLVEAIRDRLLEINVAILSRILQFDRVKIVWGSDDLGFRTGTLISPDDLRQLVLPSHRAMAEMSHEAGRPYLLHSCGKLDAIMDDLIDDVRIDAKHSFEDVIEDPISAKRKYGHRIAILGGIDVDFLCRATEEQIRDRVRRTLEACLPGGGYCLGTGNSVANYIPINNYLAMLDEGRKFGC